MQSVNHIFEVAMIMVGLNLWLIIIWKVSVHRNVEYVFVGLGEAGNGDGVINCESPH